MLLHESPYIAPLIVTAAIALASAILLFRRASTRGRVPFLAMMLGVAWWATFYALELASPDLPSKIMWTRWMYLGVLAMPAAYFSYVRRYVEREDLLRGPGKALLAVEPLLTLVLLWTNETHRLMWTWTGIATYSGTYAALVVGHGPFFWVHTLYSFVLIGLGLLLLAQSLEHATPLHRRQTLILLLTGLLPVVATLGSGLRLAPFYIVDPTPFAALITGLIFGYGLVRFELFDVLPMAREATFERMAEGVVVVNRLGRVVDMNTAAGALTGLPAKKVIGAPVGELLGFLPEALERAGDKAVWQESVDWRQSGEPRHLQLSISPLRDRRDRLAAHLVVMHDVTQSKAAENELRARSNELVYLYDTSLAVASELDLFRLLPIIVERANRLLAGNGAGLYLYREETDDLIYEVAQGLAEPFIGTVLKRGEGLCGRVLESGLPMVVEDYHHWDGRSLLYEDQEVGSVLAVPVRWLGRILGVIEVQRSSGTPFAAQDRRLMDLFANQAASALGNARLYQAAQRELQERRLAESALRASEARYRAMVQDQTELIYRMKPDWTITFANDAACRFRGRLMQQMLGHNVLEDVAPEDKVRVQQILSMISREQPALTGENRILGADGEYHWFQWTDRGIYDETGQLVELQSVGRDISERKRAEEEREKMEEQLRLAQRTEAVGILAGGVAHEFNNLLTVIQGNVELLQADLPPDPSTSGLLSAIARTTQRAAALTRQLLALSRRQVLQRVPTDLNALLTGFAPMLRHAVGQRIQVHVQLEPGLSEVLADPGAVEQVLMNLALNARDAMPEGGLMVVATRALNADQAYCAHHPTLAEGQYVCLSVSDTGTGMDEATRRHLFEPFFTTKEVGKGTGLGLSVIYGIVRQHEGAIEVQSQAGKGTTFDICLPVGGQAA